MKLPQKHIQSVYVQSTVTNAVKDAIRTQIDSMNYKLLKITTKN